MPTVIESKTFKFDVNPGDKIELWRKNDGKQDCLFDQSYNEPIEIEVTYTVKTK